MQPITSNDLSGVEIQECFAMLGQGALTARGGGGSPFTL